MEAPNITELLAAAQLEQARLSNEKLVRELASSQQKPWYTLPTQLVPIITALVSVGGFIFGISQYTAEQEKGRIDREVQSKREKETAERELMKPWLESQRAIYTEALEAAAKASNSINKADRTSAEQRFWQLYQGRMILVETTKVASAMAVFGRCLTGEEECDKKGLNDRTRNLATAMADSMGETSGLTYQEFSGKQFKYVSGR